MGQTVLPGWQQANEAFGLTSKNEALDPLAQQIDNRGEKPHNHLEAMIRTGF